MHAAAVRRLTGNQHLGFEFATEWPLYDLEDKTRALLAYASKLTDTPAMVEDADIEARRLGRAWHLAGDRAGVLLQLFRTAGSDGRVAS